MGKKRKNFNAKFKQDVLDYYYLSDKSIQAVAQELKIRQSTLNGMSPRC